MAEMYLENEYPLSDQHVESYRENGFVVLPDMLSPSEVQELRETLDDIYAHDKGGIFTGAQNTAYARVLSQRVNVWRDNESVRKFVFAKRMADAARKLAGVEHVRLWHDQALYKMPEGSKPTAFHQDFPYWPMNEDGALSVWIALNDVDEQNGAMSFIPGTHKLGKLDPIDLVNPQDIFSFAPKGSIQNPDPVMAKLPAGSCTFHNGLTFHGAGANTTDQPRRAMVIIYMPDGTTYSGKRHICTNDLNLEVGAPLTGETFPLLA